MFFFFYLKASFFSGGLRNKKTDTLGIHLEAGQPFPLFSVNLPRSGDNGKFVFWPKVLRREPLTKLSESWCPLPRAPLHCISYTIDQIPALWSLLSHCLLSPRFDLSRDPKIGLIICQKKCPEGGNEGITESEMKYWKRCQGIWTRSGYHGLVLDKGTVKINRKT